MLSWKGAKKLLKATYAMALAVAVLLSSSVSTFAADISTTNEEMSEAVEMESVSRAGVTYGGNTYPYPSVSSMLRIDTSWKTVAYSSTGFNCNVEIGSYNTGFHGFAVAKTNIRMLAKDGRVIWEEEAAIRGDGVSRVFICGSDVYTIQIRTQNGDGTAYACQTTRPAN